MIRLQAENIRVSYNGADALKGVNVTVRSGEVIGLIGPNGAGKTTLLKVCAGLLSPDQGTVRLGERAFSDWGHAERAKKLGFLPQGAVAHWPLQVRRLVALGRLPHLDPWKRPTAADDAAIDRALAKADVIHLACRGAETLSGGELARVLLARALAVEPEILLADEPVAGLDPEHQLHAMSVLRELTLDGGSVVVTLHDLSLAARYCDRLVLLHDGAVMSDGAPNEVLSEANLESAFKIQALFGRKDDSIYVVPWKCVDGAPHA